MDSQAYVRPGPGPEGSQRSPHSLGTNVCPRKLSRQGVFIGTQFREGLGNSARKWG